MHQAKKIPETKKCLQEFLTLFDKKIEFKELSFQQFETDLNSVKRNKASCKDAFMQILDQMFMNKLNTLCLFFRSCAEKEVFPNLSKIAEVSRICKSSGAYDVSNCRPISVLPVFSKLAEQIMCNRVFNYLHENKL